MDRLVSSIRDSLLYGNNVAAVAMAVMLPDICGKVEWPELGSKKRYIKWCEANLKELYQSDWPNLNSIATLMKIPYKENEDGTYKMTFLKSECLYQLRCALLHQGTSELELDKDGNPLGGFNNEFEFLEKPDIRLSVKYENATKKIVVSFDTTTFCENMCHAVEAWLENHPTNLGLRIQ